MERELEDGSCTGAPITIMGGFFCNTYTVDMAGGRGLFWIPHLSEDA